jgi:hypothetical protein
VSVEFGSLTSRVIRQVSLGGWEVALELFDGAKHLRWHLSTQKGGLNGVAPHLSYQRLSVSRKKD